MAGDKLLPIRQLEIAFGGNPHNSGAAVSQTTPYADPRGQTAARINSFDRMSRVLLGRITDTTALAHCYRVSVERIGPMVATFATQTSLAASGAKQINTLQAGSMVIVTVHPELDYAIILGVIPSAAVSAKDGMADFISQTTRTREDESHKRPLKLDGNGGIRDWSAGRPFDGTMGGEAGFITSTGTKMTIDDFMVQLAISESCGVFGFYHDDLIRLTGTNMQVWTAGSEREAFNDEGEYNDWWGVAPYPWEAMGLPDPGDPKVVKSAQDMQLCTPWYSLWEPRKDHQMPFHRVRYFNGYAGQGGHVMVATQPKSTPDLYMYKPGAPGSASAAHSAEGCAGDSASSGQTAAPRPLIGLSSDITALDGRRGLQSAKGFLIAKRLLIPQPQRLKRPEDGEGNTAENYKAAGQEGSGPEHKITGDLEVKGDHPQLQRAAGVLDLHAYFFNYAGLHPFHYRDKDYDLPEEGEMQFANQIQVTPTFSKLADDALLAPPDAVKIKIDHRYGEQDYYPNSSFLAMLEDGGVVIGDGFGAEIRMTGGHITLAAPGDIMIKSGRTTQLWGGHDVILKARNSMDLSATEHDVRIKAERNFMVLAGNDKPSSDTISMSESTNAEFGTSGSSGGQGGILLESRSSGPVFDFEKPGEEAKLGGIVLRSPKADVVTMSRGIYMRTGGGGVTEGPIVFDASQGKHAVIVNCKNHITYATENIAQYFGPVGNIEKGNVYSKGNILLDGSVAINGSLLTTSSIGCKGSLAVAGGGVGVENGSPFVGKLEGQSLTYIHAALANVQAASKTTVETGNSTYKSALDEQYYKEGKAGHDKVIQSTQFGFRTTAQYKAENYVLFEDRWQQMARLGKQELPKWEEKKVGTLLDPSTYPYPGKAAHSDDVLIQQDLTIHDGETGRSRNRGSGGDTASAYAEPKYGEPKAVKLDEYLVIAQGS